jgi:hypothetical protein
LRHRRRQKERRNTNRTFVFSTTKHRNKRSSCRLGFYVFLGSGIPILMTILVVVVDNYQVQTSEDLLARDEAK